MQPSSSRAVQSRGLRSDWAGGCGAGQSSLLSRRPRHGTEHDPCLPEIVRVLELAEYAVLEAGSHVERALTPVHELDVNAVIVKRLDSLYIPVHAALLQSGSISHRFFPAMASSQSAVNSSFWSFTSPG